MKTLLKLQSQKDEKTQPEIIDSFRGVEFNYTYTGRRQDTSNVIIEIYITSIVTDWAQNTYSRKSWYTGDKKEWKACIENHIRTHLLDLGTGQLLVKRMMRDFEVTKDKFKERDKYNPTFFQG